MQHNALSQLYQAGRGTQTTSCSLYESPHHARLWDSRSTSIVQGSSIHGFFPVIGPYPNMFALSLPRSTSSAPLPKDSPEVLRP